MILQKNLDEVSVVVVSHGINPSLFNQYWLIKEQIIDTSELENSIFTNETVQLTASIFNLLVLPGRLQFTINTQEKTIQACTQANDKLRLILRTLGETPYLAIGFNYKWLIDDKNNISKQLFFVKELDIHKSFDTQDAKFGTYMSKAFLDSTLRLDIKPVQIIKNNEPQDSFILCSFNFHIDLKERKLLDVLTDWEKYFVETNDIIDKL